MRFANQTPFGLDSGEPPDSQPHRESLCPPRNELCLPLSFVPERFGLKIARRVHPPDSLAALHLRHLI